MQISENTNKIDDLQIKLQMSNDIRNKLMEDIKIIKDENNALKEEIEFYEKIVGKRKK
jgi:hypothetical protein